jgi:hypothetical protein
MENLEGIIRLRWWHLSGSPIPRAESNHFQRQTFEEQRNYKAPSCQNTKGVFLPFGSWRITRLRLRIACSIPMCSLFVQTSLKRRRSASLVLSIFSLLTLLRSTGKVFVLQLLRLLDYLAVFITHGLETMTLVARRPPQRCAPAPAVMLR